MEFILILFIFQSIILSNQDKNVNNTETDNLIGKFNNCNKNDYNIIINPCKEKNEIRKIEFKSKNNYKCILNNTLLDFDLLLNSSQSKCNFTCGDSEFIQYNLTNQSFYCKLCSKNQYNLGQNYRICGKAKEITESNFKKLFKTDCLSLNSPILNISDIINMFETNKDNYITKYCTGFNITNENHAFVTGGLIKNTKFTENDSFKYYYGRLDFELLYERRGNFNIGYLKRSLINPIPNSQFLNTSDIQTTNNGIFYFFIDNNLTLVDDLSNNEFVFKEFIVEKGRHNFTWIYSFYKEYDVLHSKELSSFLRLEQRLLEGSNNSYTSYDCCDCGRGFALNIEKGYPKCDYCKENMYLNLNHTGCDQCPNGTFSYRGVSSYSGYDINPCIDVYECDVNDITLEYTLNITQIEKDNEREIKVKDLNIKADYIDPKICIDNKKIKEEMRKYIDSIGNHTYNDKSNINHNSYIDLFISNIENTVDLIKNNSNCPSSMKEIYYASLKTNTLSKEKDFTNNECVGLLGGVCHYWNSWAFGNFKINSRKYNPDEIWLVLTKVFNIDKSLDKYYSKYKYIEYNYTVNFPVNPSNETFQINLNGREIEKISFETLANFNQTLTYQRRIEISNSGMNQLQFIYNRTRSINKNILITINEVIISGIVSSSQEMLMKKCVFNELQLENKRNEDSISISKCPLYSNYISKENSCIPKDYIINRQYQLVFDLKSIQSFFQRECFSNIIKTSSGILKTIFMEDLVYKECEGSLIGPIRKRDILNKSKNFTFDNEKNDEDEYIFYMNLYNQIENDFDDYDIYQENMHNARKEKKIRNQKSHIFLLKNLYSNNENEYIRYVEGNTYINKTDMKEKVYFINKKVLVDIGNTLIEVKIMPFISDSSLLNKYGMYMKYKTSTNSSNIDDHYFSHIFLFCDKDSNMKDPSFIGELRKNNYYFVFLSRIACPICLKDDILSIYGKCISGKRKVMNIEGRSCIIPEESILTIEIENDILNNTDYQIENMEIINEEDMKKEENKDIHLFLNKFDYSEMDFFKNNYNTDSNNQNLNKKDKKTKIEKNPQNNNDFSVNLLLIKKNDYEECSFFSSISFFMRLFIIIGVCFYLILFFIILFFFRRYMKLRSEYSRLNNESEEIEMTSARA